MRTHSIVRGEAVGALLAAIALVAAGCTDADNPASPPDPLVIGTAQGPVRGVAEDGVRVFRGVPYAAAPVGALRWAPPEPAPSWRDVRAADSFGPSCVQALSSEGRAPWSIEYTTPAGLGVSEDCLTLNVWAPQDVAEGPRPVLVYIHGGGYFEGAGSIAVYDGSAFARRGVVVVDFNYRIGLLGFLAHPALTAEQGRSGNYGILDQIAALKWVQANIAAFGGDPDQVTIAGQSAGAMSVYALMSSPAAEGLFQRATIQSGRPGFGFAPLAQVEQAGLAVQEALGAASIEEMRAAPVEAIMAAQRGFNSLAADGQILPTDPNAPLANDVPTLLGGVMDESQPRTPSPEEFRAEIAERYGDSAADFVARYGSEPRTALRQEAADRMLLQFADWSARPGSASRRLYLFSHIEPGPDSAVWSAFHSSELPYVFGTLDRSPGRDFTSLDHEISDQMNAYWANFIATGDPNGEGLPEWPAFSADTPQALEIGDTSAPRALPTGEAARLLRESTPAPGLFSPPPARPAP